MKRLTLLLLVALLATGCSYDEGQHWEVTSVGYHGAIDLRVANFTDEQADPPRLVFRLEQSLSPENERQERFRQVDQRVPYRFGAEVGNFGIGLVNVIEMPLLVPMLLVFPSEDNTVGDYFGATAHNLNLFQANPNNDDTLFPTESVREPTGDTKVGAWTPLKDRAFVPMAQRAIVVTVSALGYVQAITTDDEGYLEVDLSAYGDQIVEQKKYTVTLAVGDNRLHKEVYFGKK